MKRAEPNSLAQQALLDAIYGRPLSPEAEAIFCRATGRTEYVPQLYKDIAIIAGRRSGKSSRIAADVAVTEATAARSLSEKATVLVIGPVMQQARITFNHIAQRFETGKLSRLVASTRRGVTENAIELITGVDIRVTAANFRHVRGSTVLACILEECAFFRDDTGANPLSEIIKAVRPGMLTIPDSKLLRVSSPWSKAGVLWDDFRLRDERLDTLCWRLPSWEMNPSLPADELERERQRDPEYFRREYGAEFLDAASALLPAEAVEAAVVRGTAEFPPSGKPYIAGLDAAFKSDAFSFSIAHAEKETITVDLVRAWQPKGKQPVRFDEVMPQIVEACKRYRIRRVFGDQICAQPIREHLERHGIRFEEVKTLGRRAGPIYSTLRAKVSAGQLRLPDVPELISQLKRLELVTTAGGGERVEASTGHDDMAVSTALAIFQADALPKKRRGSPLVMIHPGGGYSGWD